MSDTLDRELRHKYNSGVRHAKAGLPAMKMHGTKSHENAYHKGYSYGSANPPTEMQEHEHPYWSKK